MKELKVNLPHSSYQIRVGAGLLDEAATSLREADIGQGIVIITNPLVNKLYGQNLTERLTAAGFTTDVLEVPDGEEQKSLKTAEKLYEKLTALYADRQTSILALGGGVIGDLAGFIAATYMRGLPLVQMPTTLLAQVDSSIGGKVAVNQGGLKNNIGAFYQPKLVLSDTTALKTLPAEEFANGLAEVIKSAVLGDAGLFSFLEENMAKIQAQDEAALEEIVARSAGIKARVVMEDEKDQGLRNTLNFGHTIGHAVETASGLKIRHGAAVAIGMLAAGDIANRLGVFDKKELGRLKKVIQAAGLPTEIASHKIKEMVEAIKHDKKIQSGKIRFVLPRAIGNVYITDKVDLPLVEKVLVG